MSEILVLNNSYMPIAKTNWERAIILMLLGKAVSVKDSNIEVKSQNLSIKIPEIISLKEVNYVRRQPLACTKKAVFRRDNYTCQMCGEDDRAKLTLEHLIPRSRWNKISKERNLTYGLGSWENLCTLCKFCNSKVKANSLPEEIGWEFTAKAPLTDFDIDWDALLSMGN